MTEPVPPGPPSTGQVQVLGPVLVATPTGVFTPVSPAHRALLGALGAADGRPVSTGSLARRLGLAEPDGAATRGSVQVAVHRLRRWLADIPGAGLSVATTTDGYALSAAPVDTDVRRFRALVAQAIGLAGRERIALLHQALSLWRGEPLADVPDERRDREATAHLARERASAVRSYAVAAIAHGAADDAADMLAPFTRRDPLDEAIHALRIRALAAAGRQAEALAVYQQISDALRADLGVVPGTELAAAHLAVLQPAEETAPDQAADRPLDLLPPPADHFVGRADLLSRLGEHARAWASAGDSATSVAAISGPPGVGKTALAVQSAHSLRDAFPGGLLYVDLRGAEAVPCDPHEVLDRFLRALGVAEPLIPESRDERAALYRSRLADTRALLLLDNAADEDQVRALLPGVGCLVLVTSRRRLSGVAGTVALEVDVLPEVDARALLAAMAGPDRLAGSDRDATELVHSCGRLPLALRIVAGRLAANPHWTVAHMARLLADERRRLDELSLDHLDVRASFNLAYVGLDEPARRLFRTLAELDLVDFPGWVAPAILDQPAGLGDALDLLVEARLVDVAGTDPLGQSRLTLHDLVRLFGRERAHDEDDPSTTRTALGRVFDGWLYLAQQGAKPLAPPDEPTTAPPLRPRPPAIGPAQAERLLTEPLRLFNVEGDRIVRATLQACHLDLSPTNWELPYAVLPYWESTCGWDAWRRTHEAALAASRRAGDLLGEAFTLTGLASCYLDQRQHSAAIELLEQAAAVSRRLGDTLGEAETRRLLAIVLRRSGRLAEAEAASISALELFGTAPNTRFEQSFVWLNLGWIDIIRHRFESARERLTRALELAQAEYLLHLGNVMHAFLMLELRTGEYQAGVDWAERQLAVWRRNSDQRGEAHALVGLGRNLMGLGRYDEARLVLLDSFSLMEEFAMIDGQAEVLIGLAALHRQIGDPASARALIGRALELNEQIESPLQAADAWLEQAAVHDCLGEPTAARRARERAISFLDPIAAPLADTVRAQL